MAILPIVQIPDIRLKQKSLPINKVDDSIRKIMDNMLETMYYNKGVGLAAIQVGINKCILVIDLQNNDDIERDSNFYPLFIANPQIIDSSTKKIDAIEGCLSIPDNRVLISRAETIKISFLNYHNDPIELETEGWLARVIQHEVDHLNGKLLIDYI